MNSYIISFAGIESHEEIFHFHLNDEFWSEIESEEIMTGDVMATVTATPAPGHKVDLHFHFKGEVVVPCDRCLDALKLPVDTENELVVEFGPEFLDEGDDYIVVSERDQEADLSWIMYEFVALSLPQTRKHDIDKCNPEMLKYLTQEVVDDEDDAWTDPRWDALKKLKE